MDCGLFLIDGGFGFDTLHLVFNFEIRKIVGFDASKIYSFEWSLGVEWG